MATGVQPFDSHMKGISRAFHEMVKPYTGVINARGTQFSYVTFEIGIMFGDAMVSRDVGPFDMAEDFDDPRMRDKVSRALVDATREACDEMMDPIGLLKTISVKEVYANG